MFGKNYEVKMRRYGWVVRMGGCECRGGGGIEGDMKGIWGVGG